MPTRSRYMNLKETPMKIHAALAAILMLLSGSVLAHPGHIGGMAEGLHHPYSGLDHALAMLAVGLWAAQQSTRDAIWKIPLAFVTAMLAGSILAMQGVTLPAVEAGIVASVLALGLFVAFALRLPTVAGMGVVAVFALMHGYAHGIEAPVSGSMLTFMTGFAIATASLHLIGMLLGWYARNRAELLLRAGGIGVTAGGAWMALGA